MSFLLCNAYVSALRLLLTCCSKSEYVRCLHFTNEDTLYVATNRGYLYRAKLFENGDVSWTEIVQVSEKVPIVCMDLLSKPFKPGRNVEDWIAVGDGKGNITIARVIGDVCSPEVDISFSWSAGQERQLLGSHWCRPLGYGYEHLLFSNNTYLSLFSVN